MTDVRIRAARTRDVNDLFALIRELASQERALAKFGLTPETLKGVLFGKQKRAACFVATIDAKPVGLALWFYAFSSLRGGWMIFLEDLVVRRHYRGRGIGRALLAHIAKHAVRENCLGVVWVARTSNRRAVSFYKRLSAKQYSDSSHFVLFGEALNELAKEGT